MRHGGDIYNTARSLGCSADEIIDFSSNINSYQSGKSMTLDPTCIKPYGDSSYNDLKNAIGRRYGISSDQTALFNGATAAISALMQQLDPKDVTLYMPLYGEYETAARHYGKRIHKIDRFTALYQKPKQGSIVVFVNPATPDGTCYNVGKLLEIWREQQCTIIMDESFLEFEALQSVRQEIEHLPSLYIIQSFSKFYGCAGVRIGAVFSQKSNIGSLYIPLWNLSALDADFLKQRLADDDFVTESRKYHLERKKELREILEASGRFESIYESCSNYILTHSPQGYRIYQQLLRSKILVRHCESFDTLTRNHLRFAVKDQASHRQLKRALHALA